MLGDRQVSKNTVEEREKTKGRASSVSGDDNDSWSPCSGLNFTTFRTAASLRSFCILFGQKKKEKKDDEKRRKKDGDTKGSSGFFTRTKTVKGSDSDNDSDGDDVVRPGGRYNAKRDGQRRSNEASGVRDSKNRGIIERSKFDTDHCHLISKRDSYGPGKDIENFLSNKKDRDDNSDDSPVLRKSERVIKASIPKETDLHERNKSYSGMERKCNEKHFRTNSSMI